MKKIVLKLDLIHEKDKRKAMKCVTNLAGIDSISVDMKGMTMTVVGDADPISVVKKLRKQGLLTEVVTIGPAKEEKKTDDKKDDGKKKAAEDSVSEVVKAFKYYNPSIPHYYAFNGEENPNPCVVS